MEKPAERTFAVTVSEALNEIEAERAGQRKGDSRNPELGSPKSTAPQTVIMDVREIGQAYYFRPLRVYENTPPRPVPSSPYAK